MKTFIVETTDAIVTIMADYIETSDRNLEFLEEDNDVPIAIFAGGEWLRVSDKNANVHIAKKSNLGVR